MVLIEIRSGNQECETEQRTNSIGRLAADLKKWFIVPHLYFADWINRYFDYLKLKKEIFEWRNMTDVTCFPISPFQIDWYVYTAAVTGAY